MNKPTKICSASPPRRLCCSAHGHGGRHARSASSLGLTGPLDTLSPPMLAPAELAAKNINDQGGINGGQLKLSSPATTTASPPIWPPPPRPRSSMTAPSAIVGAMCSGVTGRDRQQRRPFRTASLRSRRRPRLATITTLEDKDLVFRTSPSDAYKCVKSSPRRCSPAGVKERGRHLRQQRLRQGSRRRVLGGLHRRWRHGSRPTSRTKKARPTTAPNSASWQPPAPEPRWSSPTPTARARPCCSRPSRAATSPPIVGGDGMVGNALLEGLAAGALDGMIATRPSGADRRGQPRRFKRSRPQRAA